MVAWSHDELHDDRFGSFYMQHDEDMHRAAELERRQTLGDHTLFGYSRPVYPDCPRHGYGMVDGKCGMCLLAEKQIAERRAA